MVYNNIYSLFGIIYLSVRQLSLSDTRGYFYILLFYLFPPELPSIKKIDIYPDRYNKKTYKNKIYILLYISNG